MQEVRITFRGVILHRMGHQQHLGAESRNKSESLMQSKAAGLHTGSSASFLKQQDAAYGRTHKEEEEEKQRVGFFVVIHHHTSFTGCHDKTGPASFLQAH